MIPCTFRQLEVFAAAAETNHFGRAADALGISQPAVTKQIATLERQIGMTLFVRRRGARPVLSRDGAAFLGQAKKFLAEGQSLSAHCPSTTDDPSVVRIASGAHLLSKCIKPWLPDFARSNDAVMIACNPVGSSAEGLALLAAGDADVLVYTMAQLHAPGCHIEPVRPVRLSLYGGRSYQSLRTASPEEISELPFVLPPAGSEGERLVLNALTDAGVTCSKIALRLQYSEVAKQLVVDGLGVAALYDTMAEEHVARGELIRFDLKMPVLQRSICRREHSTGAAVDAVVEALRDVLQR